MNRRMAEILLVTIPLNAEPFSGIHSLFYMVVSIASKPFMITMKGGQFYFGTVLPSHCYRCTINNSTSLFLAVKN
jgi:hypothetical protein